MVIFSPVDSLVNDSRFFGMQLFIRSSCLLNIFLAQVNPQVIPAAHAQPTSSDSIKAVVVSILGSDFPLNSSEAIIRITGLAVYDELNKILPVRSPETAFFWSRLARPFASMLDTAEYSILTQIVFLTFIYARVVGMMGSLGFSSPASYMTFDGSPVELSWVFPKSVKPGDGDKARLVRFAIEPIDPRSGRLLPGLEVLKYLTSPKGSLGLVTCSQGALDWSIITEQFLYSGAPEKRFFVGFDFSRSGEIVLKTYYIPRTSNQSEALSHKASKLCLWDVDYRPLRSLLTTLDPSLMESLNMMISFVDGEEALYKPRLQIISMDCVSNDINRLKMYCRPSQGTSWNDVRHSFTLGGRLNDPKMDRALSWLELLWNLLFPFAHSQSHSNLDEGLKLYRADQESVCHRRSADHPTGGLLFYYSLVPGSDIILPKVYLPVSRYCANDLAIAEALEQFYTFEGRGHQAPGWVAREVSSAYNHRPLKGKTGIHTYVTFALKKNYEWELTSYFSPEVWESS